MDSVKYVLLVLCVGMLIYYSTITDFSNFWESRNIAMWAIPVVLLIGFICPALFSKKKKDI